MSDQYNWVTATVLLKIAGQKLTVDALLGYWRAADEEDAIRQARREAEATHPQMSVNQVIAAPLPKHNQLEGER
jgi:hypothetical protein